MDIDNKIIVRRAAQEDKTDFKTLWSLCFEDSNAFRDWFFENRFRSSHSVVLEVEGKIASCMQGFPYSIWLRGKEVPGAMLCGVSTHPKERKKGYMSKIFSYELNLLSKIGCVVAPHTPAVLSSYFSFGHYPVADALYLESNEIPPLPSVMPLIELNRKDWQKCFLLYEQFARKYSGMIKRSETDFMMKFADYSSDGGRAAVYMKEGEIKGYCFYYLIKKQIFCIEAIAEDGYWKSLIEGLCALYPGFSLKTKLPPDLDIFLPYAFSYKEQKGVMGLCDVSNLLKYLALNIPYGIHVKDPIVLKNNGVFDFHGAYYNEEPVFSINAGHLIQVLIGYHSLEELRNEIEICDEQKFAEINLMLPKQNCYIIDEY